MSSMYLGLVSNNPMKVVGHRINQALAPWNAGGAVVYQSHSFETRDIRITIEIELLPKLPFVCTINPINLSLLTEAELSRMIAREAFDFYWNRPTLPIDDHIVLGEN